MKTYPIIFSAPMVRALLDGKKTQTRRVVKPQPEIYSGYETLGDFSDPGWVLEWKEFDALTPKELAHHCPYGKPGDLLWVRETWQLHSLATDLGKIVYRASENSSHTEFHRMVPVEKIGGIGAKPFQEGWRSSIHMPRWASRLTLEITGVRVERVHDISEDDAIAEGMMQFDSGRWWYDTTGQNSLHRTAMSAYQELWRKLNGCGSWDANPWVWVLEFRVHKQNVDQFTKAAI